MTGRILIVDGVATNRIQMKVRLSAACHEVAALGSAQQAIQMLQNDLPQIILLGSSLPDMSNIDLCRLLRSQPGCRRIPILMQVPESQRLAALSAGATAIVEGPGDDLTLMARIRGLLRSASPDPEDSADIENAAIPGLQEAAASFRPADTARIMFVTNQSASALGWRQALQRELSQPVLICDPERALAEAQAGQVADIYLIAADIHQPGDGLRLLSELRSRNHSRHAGFVVVLRPEREDMTAVALDLGAGDVLSSALLTPGMAAEAAILVRAQLERKQLADRRRRETQRNLMWAMVDPLTGVHNRRYALPQLSEMAAHVADNQQCLGVIVMDIDHFKQVNDRHGHAAGDATLVDVAERLRETLPDGALLARIGGEEFMAAFPTSTPTDAVRMAERLRDAIALRPFRLPSLTGGTSVTVTISLGVATMTAHHASRALPTAEALIARADHALLNAKSQGRNCTVVAGPVLAA